jgi:uncharacterized protein YwgA
LPRKAAPWQISWQIYGTNKNQGETASRAPQAAGELSSEVSHSQNGSPKIFAPTSCVMCFYSLQNRDSGAESLERMNRQQIGLKLVLDQLGQTLDLRTFDRRLALQKTVYLCQKAGVNLGYPFRWYLRGPYSRELTADAFQILSTPGGLADPTAQGWSLDEKSTKKLAKIRSFLASIPKQEATKQLELVASVHFVIAYNQGKADHPQGIEQTLRKAGKLFSLEEIRNAIGELTTHGFLPKAQARC